MYFQVKKLNMKLLMFVLVVEFKFMIAADIQENDLNKKVNAFCGKMFNKVTEETPGQSKVISAFSVLTPLGVLAIGSKGSTHDEILNAIGLPDDEYVKQAFRFFNKELMTVKELDLIMANKFFVNNKYELDNNFIDETKNNFRTEIIKLNFKEKEQSAEEMNDWISAETNNRFKDVIQSESINDDSRIFLVNVIYFKGNWKYRFPKDATSSKEFYKTKETIIKVPMMSIKENYKYGMSDRLDAKILEMPYAGDQSSMILILPNAIDGIGNLISKLEDFNLEKINAVLETETVHVFLPKFKIETTIDLKKILQQMDVKKIFSDEADIDKLLAVPEKLYVTDATQKAFIEVNEEGTEAAAVNNFGIPIVKPNIKRETKFLANHPFIFLINFNHKIIFSGAYYGN